MLPFSAGNALFHFDGTSWKQDPASPAIVPVNGLNAVWGTSSSDVWAAGTAGSMLHYDGSHWSSSTPVTGAYLRGGWGSAPNDQWIVGPAGAALHLTAPTPTQYGGQCTAPIPLYCGTTATPVVQFGAVKSTGNQFSSYACASGESGGEAYYRLESPVTGQVTVTLTPEGTDVDLIQVGADAIGGCAASGACMASKTASATTAETITVSATQGETLYFIVDGPAAANASFAIKTSCVKQ